MRGWPLLGLLGVLTLGIPAAPAQDAPPSDDADRAALRTIKATFEEAVKTNRLDLMLPYLDEPFSVVTYTDREFTDFNAFKAQWQKTRADLLEGGSYDMELLPERTRFFGDLAVARGDSRNTLVKGDGRTFHFTSHWTAVFRRVGGQWKVVRAHNSLSPFDNEMLVAGVRRMVLKWSAVAAAVGLVLGGGLVALFKRRRAS